MWFVFNDAGRSVALWASFFTGKVEIFSGQRKVWTGRQTRSSVRHSARIDGKAYTFEIAMVSAWDFVIECIVTADGQFVRRFRTERRSSSLFSKRDVLIGVCGVVPFWLVLRQTGSWVTALAISFAGFFAIYAVASLLFPGEDARLAVREFDS